MSTSTEHLGLHQWEAGDSFLRTDFNEDFAKIDAGVKAAHALAEQSSASGSYTVTDREAFDIELGFRPKLVLMFCPGERQFAFAAENIFMEVYYSVNCTVHSYQSGVTFTDSGFHVNSSCVVNNDTGAVVYYGAFR